MLALNWPSLRDTFVECSIRSLPLAVLQVSLVLRDLVGAPATCGAGSFTKRDLPFKLQSRLR